jgi:hypothetical protein
MVVVPPLTPLTTPVEDTTVATDVLLLLHVPPDAVFVNVVVDPSHTVNVPPMVPGVGVTLTAWVEAVPQPVL